VIAQAGLGVLAVTVIMLVAARLSGLRVTLGQGFVAGVVVALVSFTGMAIVSLLPSVAAVIAVLTGVTGASVFIIKIIFAATWGQAALVWIINVGAQSLLAVIIRQLMA